MLELRSRIRDAVTIKGRTAFVTGGDENLLAVTLLSWFLDGRPLPEVAKMAKITVEQAEDVLRWRLLEQARKVRGRNDGGAKKDPT
jgi:hypothetical protein